MAPSQPCHLLKTSRQHLDIDPAAILPVSRPRSEPPSSNSNFWLGEPFRPSIRYTTVPECAYCLRLELREHLPDTSSLATDATTSTTDFALLMIFTMSQCNGHSLQAGYISWDRDPFQPLPAVFKLYSTAPLMRHFLRPLYVLPTSITHEPFNGPDLWLARSHARKDRAMCLLPYPLSAMHHCKM